jgi:hypothetical protein
MTIIWLWLIIGAATIWIIIRLIRKFTRWLDVEGR